MTISKQRPIAVCRQLILYAMGLVKDLLLFKRLTGREVYTVWDRVCKREYIKLQRLISCADYNNLSPQQQGKLYI